MHGAAEPLVWFGGFSRTGEAKVKMKALLLSCSAIVLAGSAMAADLPSRKAPVSYIEAPPVFTWTGFYVGLNAGAAFRTGNDNNNNAFFAGNNNGGNSTGFVGGGQLGYNWQSGAIVWGLETDAQYRSNIGNNANNGFFGGGNNNNGGFYGTTRGRLGFAFSPMFMAYITGGAAYGNVANNQFGGFGFNNNNGSNFRLGYAAGAGVEFAMTPNWSIKAEALYNDLGRSNQNAFFGNTSRNQFVVARLGVNYKFGWGGPSAAVARY